MTSKSTDECNQYGHTGCGGNEILDGQPDHLGQVTHGCLTAVILPVGIGNKANRGIQR